MGLSAASGWRSITTWRASPAPRQRWCLLISPEGTTTIRVGAGGIMLPNHAPYVIAEQFGTLARLFPGRIDLGLGRAPGTDQLTLHALRRPPEAAETFPQDVLELQAFLAPASPEPTHPGRAGGRNGGAALDPRIKPFRRDAGRRTRTALCVRVAFRARSSDFRAADLPRALQAVRAARPAVRDGRGQYHRRRKRRRRRGGSPRLSRCRSPTSSAARGA